MPTDPTRQAAQEFLAEKRTQDFEAQEARLNHEAAVRLCRVVWKRFSDTVLAKCKEWNEVTGEETLSCKETLLGDLRIRCVGRPHQLTMHLDPDKLLITLKNTARAEFEKDVVLQIEGYATESERDARTYHAGSAANLDVILLAEFRVLAGMSSQR
ncbi:MAG TPA: hypothetical protein VEU98_01355 [Candidatus Eremiobacteraceae bacterium]|nr:hypothetical protein [Candidatus Eremiobacteraceae bacterium]